MRVSMGTFQELKHTCVARDGCWLKRWHVGNQQKSGRQGLEVLLRILYSLLRVIGSHGMGLIQELLKSNLHFGSIPLAAVWRQG